MYNTDTETINPTHFADEPLVKFQTRVTQKPKDGYILKRYTELQPESGLVIVKPPRVPDLPESVLSYEKAEELAEQIDFRPGLFQYGYVSGEFIFGDLIEALFVKHNLHTKRLLIATLALSYENVDSLKNLLAGGYVDKLDLTYSDYQFSMERSGVVPYMYEELAGFDFQLTVARSHSKLACFTTDEGLAIGLRGSANLRSASCLEQLFINESPTMNAVDEAVYDDLAERFATINRNNKQKAFRPKPISRQKIWKFVKESLEKLTH